MVGSSLGGGLVIIAVLVAVAVGLLVWAIARLAMHEETGLRAALAAYDPGVVDGDDDGEFKGREIQLSESALLQRAISVTERIATERGIMPKLERMLEKADLPLQAAEGLFVYVAAVILFTVATLFLVPPFIALLFIVIVAILPWAVLAFMASRRQSKFTSQLPDMLQLLAGSLRAGFSLLQGVEAVSQEVGDPMGRELRRVLTEARLGRPLEEALDD